MGLRAIAPLAGWVLIGVVGALIVRTVWQTIRSAVPPVHRLASRVEFTVSSVVSRRTPRDRLGLARWLLLAQVIVVIALAVTFEPLWMALFTPFNTADPSVWQVLFYSSDQTGPVNGYQALLPISATAMALGWWRLIRSAGGLVALDRTDRRGRILDRGAAHRRRRGALASLQRREASPPIRDRRGALLRGRPPRQ